MKNKFFLPQLLVICCFSFSAIANSDFDPYFEANTINPKLIDPPLKLESKERQDEIKQIIELQNNITAKEIELATEEYSIVPESMITKVIPDLTRKQYVEFYKLLDRVEETALNVKDSIKYYWKVERPYQVSRGSLQEGTKFPTTPSKTFIYLAFQGKTDFRIINQHLYNPL
ncbi:MAG: hypothetical protein KGQ36_05965 [Rickettsiales bacterium]|nr:hypothetical protein [Rickettsiales bacterium]